MKMWVPKLKPDEVRCGVCDEVFVKANTEEDAKEEFRERNPDLAEGLETHPEMYSVVCDPCFHKMNKWWEGLPEEERQRIHDEALAEVRNGT